MSCLGLMSTHPLYKVIIDYNIYHKRGHVFQYVQQQIINYGSRT